MGKFKLGIRDLVILTLIILAGGIPTYLHISSQTKIGYIKTSEVLNKYQGMLDAKAELSQRTKQWQATIDTMEYSYKTALDNYRLEENKLSGAVQAHRLGQLSSMEQELKDYVSAVQERNSAEGQKKIQGVVNQVNSFVQKYAAQKGYTVVLGTTTDGNIMYGDEAIDLTDAIIEGINAEYK